VHSDQRGEYVLADEKHRDGGDGLKRHGRGSALFHGGRCDRLGWDRACIEPVCILLSGVIVLFLSWQISYWLPGHQCNGCVPSGAIADPNMNEQTYFLDVSSDGDLYADYYGCNANFTICGNGFERITTPQPTRRLSRSLA
jgi:hypothetical protein